MASVACQTRLTLMTHMAYRHIIRFSRTAWCKSCASGRSQPCYCFWRSIDIRDGVTQPTAYRISHGTCLRRPWHMIPCAYIWVPFQLRRSLVAFALDLPIMSVHGAGAYDVRKRRLHATRRSGTQFMVTFVSGVRYIRSERARSRLTPGGSSAFR